MISIDVSPKLMCTRYLTCTLGSTVLPLELARKKAATCKYMQCSNTDIWVNFDIILFSRVATTLQWHCDFENVVNKTRVSFSPFSSASTAP